MPSLRVQTLLWLFAALTLAGCRNDSSDRDGGAVITVIADTGVRARLVRLEARVYPAAATRDASPERLQAFVLKPGDTTGAPRVMLPFSFSIAQGQAPRFQLAVVGFDSFAADATPVIERRLIAAFAADRLVKIDVVLADACLDRVQTCGFETCQPRAGANGPAGTCGPVEEVTEVPADASVGREGDAAPATVDGAGPAMGSARSDGGLDLLTPEAGSHDGGQVATHDHGGEVTQPDGGGDAATQNDGGVAPAADADAGAVALLPPETLTCPFEGVCRLPGSPCTTSDDGQGYQCRGQLAAWPMPDSQPEAKTRPKYSAREGVVLDEVTGLLWQQPLPVSYPGCDGNRAGTPGDSCSLAQADLYCSQLQLEGKRWRLPSKIELESILDFTSVSTRTAVDEAFFPDSKGHFWTSTACLVPGCMGKTFVVPFDSASSGPFAPESYYRVRCVRSERIDHAPPSEQYEVDSSKGIVRDRYTSLEWQQKMSVAQMPTLADAEAYCTSAGDGFRVPTIKELLTLADITRSQVAISPVFDKAEGLDRTLWSTTRNFLGGTIMYGWMIAQFIPDNLAGNGELRFHVRCVR
jgi:hypothetical protein